MLAQIERDKARPVVHRAAHGVANDDSDRLAFIKVMGGCLRGAVTALRDSAEPIPRIRSCFHEILPLRFFYRPPLNQFPPISSIDFAAGVAR